MRGALARSMTELLLPAELLLELLHFAHTTDLVQWSAVSVRWRWACHTALRARFLAPPYQWRRCLDLDYSPECVEAHDDSVLFPPIPQPVYALDGSRARALTRSLPKLLRFVLGGPDGNSITSLNLCGLCGLENVSLWKLLHACPVLLHLNMRNIGTTTVMPKKSSVANSWQHPLESLVISCDTVGSDCELHLLTPNLRFLALVGQSLIQSATWLSLPESLVRLRASHEVLTRLSAGAVPRGTVVEVLCCPSSSTERIASRERIVYVNMDGSRGVSNKEQELMPLPPQAPDPLYFLRAFVESTVSCEQVPSCVDWHERLGYAGTVLQQILYNEVPGIGEMLDALCSRGLVPGAGPSFFCPSPLYLISQASHLQWRMEAYRALKRNGFRLSARSPHSRNAAFFGLFQGYPESPLGSERNARWVLNALEELRNVFGQDATRAASCRYGKRRVLFTTKVFSVAPAAMGGHILGVLEDEYGWEVSRGEVIAISPRFGELAAFRPHLIRAFRESGVTPIHSLCRSRVWTNRQTQFVTMEEWASVRTRTGETVLHFLARLGRSLPWVSLPGACLAANLPPEVYTAQTTDRGASFLMYASSQLMDYVMLVPEGIRRDVLKLQDNDGKTVLAHLLAHRRPLVSRFHLRTLLLTCPELIEVPDHKGLFPVSYLLWSNTYVGERERLLEEVVRCADYL